MKPRALASQLKDRVRVRRPIDTHSPMGAVLAEHLPIAADDANELPDRLIEV